jgi:hypothetical protein
MGKKDCQMSPHGQNVKNFFLFFFTTNAHSVGPPADGTTIRLMAVTRPPVKPKKTKIHVVKIEKKDQTNKKNFTSPRSRVFGER